MPRRDKIEQEYIIGRRIMDIILHLPQRIQERDRRDYLREKELADIVQKRLESADIDS